MIALKATRMELLNLRKKIRLARRGHKLLKEKRDALITEFFSIIETLATVREDFERRLARAFEKLTLALAYSGKEAIERASLSVSTDLDVILKTKVIMGVKVPIIEISEQKSKKLPEYELIGTSSLLDDAAEDFKTALTLVLNLAEIEHTLKLLAQEIKKTKRKVNSLEQILIPRFEKFADYVAFRLEEIAREDFVRLKVIKSKLFSEKI
jgi:V/A-type H+-transporting ATPase subunit D